MFLLGFLQGRAWWYGMAGGCLTDVVLRSSQNYHQEHATELRRLPNDIMAVFTEFPIGTSTDHLGTSINPCSQCNQCVRLDANEVNGMTKSGSSII